MTAPDFASLLAAAVGTPSPGSFLDVDSSVDRLVHDGRLAPDRLPAGHVALMATDRSDPSDNREAALSAIYQRHGESGFRVVHAAANERPDVASSPPVTPQSLMAIKRSYAEWAGADPHEARSGEEADREAASLSRALDLASGVPLPEVGPGRPTPQVERRRASAEAVREVARLEAPRQSPDDLAARSRAAGFLLAIPDDVLRGVAGWSPQSEGRPKTIVTRDAEGRIALGFGASSSGLASLPLDLASAAPRILAGGTTGRERHLAAANEAMAEVALATRRLPPVRDPSLATPSGAMAGVLSVVSTLDPRALSELVRAAGSPGPVEGLSLASARVVPPSTGTRPTPGRTVVAFDATASGAAQRTFPLLVAFDHDALGLSLSVVPADGRSARLHADVVNGVIPQPWTGRPDAGRSTVATLSSGTTVSVQVSRADLAAMMRKPGGEGVPPVRAADLAALAFAVRQPRYEGDRVVGERTGIAAVENLHDHYGSGRGPRRLHLDPDALAALASVGGPAASGLVLRLASTERSLARQRTRDASRSQPGASRPVAKASALGASR